MVTYDHQSLYQQCLVDVTYYHIQGGVTYYHHLLPLMVVPQCLVDVTYYHIRGGVTYYHHPCQKPLTQESV